MKRRILRYAAVLSVLLFIAPVKGFTAEGNKTGELFEESFTFEAAGNYDSSIKSVSTILRMYPKDYTATLRMAWLTYLKGDFAASETFYKKAVALAPNAIEPRQGLILPLMAAKKWAECESAARQILRMDEKNYVAISKLAYTMFLQGKYGEAMIRYQKALDLYPSDVNMKLGLAWSYLNMGQKSDASRLFGEVLKVYRNNQNALAGMEAARK